MANHTFTLKIPVSEAPRLKQFFLGHGFEIRDLAHAFWQAKGLGCVASFYKSGKLVMQGPEADTWRGLIGDDTPEARPYASALSKHPKPPPPQWIGTDEAGKGDYFGPLVVAGALIKRDQLELLQTLGIDDSKALSDERLPAMVRGIEAACITEVMVITPAKYNELYARIGNLNKLLSWAHGKVIENLLTREKAPWALVDKFVDERVLRRSLGPLGSSIQVDARTKAEEDPAVGAASVLARAAYLRNLRSLSRRFGVTLSAGAGAPTLRSGRALIEAHGKGALAETAKLHFRTTEQIGGR
ncbi:MAG: ribonuclease HIII [Bradymonadia bacterium]